MRKTAYLLCLLLVVSVMLQAQTRIERRDADPDRTSLMQQGNVPGELRISQDTRIDELINRHVLFNDKRKGIEGYRIQIYFGSGAQGREESGEHNARALSYFPDLKVHLMYQYSYYKVRIGDFRTREEAFFWYTRVKRRFPNAYIVPDTIEFPDLDTKK